MKKPSAQIIITGGVVTLVLTTAFIFFISVRQADQVKDTGQKVEQTRELIHHTQRLIMSALDNETGSRGFVITGDDSFLEPLFRANAVIEQEILWLQANQNLTDNQKYLIDSLNHYIKIRRHFSDSMISVRRTKGLPALVTMVQEGVGKSYTDKIRELGLELENAEQQILDQRRKRNEKTITNLNVILFSVLGILLMVGLFSLYVLKTDIHKQELSERKFRALLDAAPDATVIVDEGGVIRMINQQAERLFGYTKEEMIGKRVEMLIPEALRGRHKDHRSGYADAPRVRMMGVGMELQALKKDGNLFPVAISLSPIRTAEGMMVSASVRDITESKDLEWNLRKSNEELEAFTYSVSHDLRAPLRSITGFTSILETEYANKLDGEALRITSVIKTNALRMGNLIDDLLGFSRMGRKELVKLPMDMEICVKEIVSEISNQPGHTHIQFQLEPLPTLKADANTMRQVWINLISNAVKYSSKQETPFIQIGYYKQPGQHVFFVKDNGVGFDMKYSDKLFKVFQRLHNHNDFEGTGVGLALVQKIVSKHGGRVWAEGEPDKGARFYFSLGVE